MDRRKNIFDMIGSLIPGYTGYAEREGRRNCDKILRDSISTDLSAIETSIYERINVAMSDKDFELGRNLEEDRKKINTLCSQVRYSPHGATAFFSDDQIREEELLQIYKIDFELMEIVIVLKKRIIDVAPSELKNLIIQSQNIINKRDNLINQFK
jgi:hypothetical protein